MSPSDPGAARTVAIAVVAPLVTFAALLGAWALLAAHNGSVVPSPGAVFAELAEHSGFYLRNAGVTLGEVAVGLAISFVAAFGLAVGMVHAVVLERALMPLAVVVNVTPVMAIAPALVVALGFGAAPKYLVTALVCFFPLLVNALVGLRAVDPGVLEVARSLEASRAEVLWRLRLPSSAPFLFAAARVCLPLAVVGAVVAEFLTAGTPHGLGSVIGFANQYDELPVMYAAIVCLAVVGVLLSAAVVLAERELCAWHPSGATAGTA